MILSRPLFLTYARVISQHEVAHEGVTGKISRANFHDRSGRTVLIMRPGMQVCTVFSPHFYLVIFIFLALKQAYCDEAFANWPLTFSSAIWQTTKCTEDNVRYMVYLLENGILNLADGQEQMSWLIDFTGWSLSTNIPIKTSRDCINVLQNHYPQRLAIAFLYNPPRIFEAFWKVCSFVTRPFCLFWA